MLAVEVIKPNNGLPRLVHALLVFLLCLTHADDGLERVPPTHGAPISYLGRR